MKQEDIVRNMSLSEQAKIGKILRSLKALSRNLYIPNESPRLSMQRWEKLDILPVSIDIFEKIILSTLFSTLNSFVRYGCDINPELNENITLDVWKVRLNNDIVKCFKEKTTMGNYSEWRNLPPFKGNLKDEPTLYFFHDFHEGDGKEIQFSPSPIIILDLTHNSVGSGIGNFIIDYPEGMIAEIHPCIKYIDKKPVAFLSLVFQPMIVKMLIEPRTSELLEEHDIIHQHWHFETKIPCSESEYVRINIDV